MISGQTQRQGIEGNVIGGNVTAQFPEGIIVLKASSDLNEKECIQLIKEKISSYPCSCSNFIDLNPGERIHSFLAPGIMTPNIFQVHDRIRTWREAALGEYWLNLSIETDQDEVFLKFLGEAIYYDSQEVNDRGRILREELFNQTIKMNLDLVYFVGFAPPKVKNAYRGSAYWFIIIMEN